MHKVANVVVGWTQELADSKAKKETAQRGARFVHVEGASDAGAEGILYVEHRAARQNDCDELPPRRPDSVEVAAHLILGDRHGPGNDMGGEPPAFVPYSSGAPVARVNHGLVDDTMVAKAQALIRAAERSNTAKVEL